MATSNSASDIASESRIFSGDTIQPQVCEACGAAHAAGGDTRPPAYVYAIGRIAPRFPRLSAEKEFAQAMGRAEVSGLTDRQALHEVLSKPGHRYLLR